MWPWPLTILFFNHHTQIECCPSTYMLAIKLHAAHHITCCPSRYILSINVHAAHQNTCCPSNYMLHIKLHAAHQITCCLSNYMLLIKLHAAHQITCCSSNYMLPIKLHAAYQSTCCLLNCMLPIIKVHAPHQSALWLWLSCHFKIWHWLDYKQTTTEKIMAVYHFMAWHVWQDSTCTLHMEN